MFTHTISASQHTHDLTPDGIAGSAAFNVLAKESRELAGSGRSLQPPPYLDDASHPDHAFYLQTHSLVCELDRQHGRTPDQFSANLSSALVVSGRQAGLARIDRLALGEGASVVWGAQDLPGGPLADKYCRVDTLPALNTSMEQSAAQWGQAMQHYHRLQDAPMTQDRPPASPRHGMLAAQER